MAGRKVVVNHRQELLGGSMRFLQIWQEAVLALLVRLFDQHLGVTNDLIERRAKIVEQRRWQRVPGGSAGGRFRCDHEAVSPVEAGLPRRLLSSASILPS